MEGFPTGTVSFLFTDIEGSRRRSWPCHDACKAGLKKL